jgi:hypothetical protein
MSRYSPTVMPNLVIKRAPASSPQNLRPENDPLLVERVLTRCKFNDAMTPKPKRFHGSRAFLNDSGNGQAQAPAERGTAQAVQDPPVEPTSGQSNQAQSVLAQGMFADFGPPEPAPKKMTNDFFRAAIKTGEAVPREPEAAPESVREFGWGEAPVAGEGAAVQSDERVVSNPRPGDNNGNEFPFDQPRSSDSQSQESRRSSDQEITSDQHPAGSKLVRNAPHPSFMVADWLLLVVQENDGQTLSLTRTVEGDDFEPVFGLLPSMSDFNIVMAQELPPTAVSLSANALSFHDANNEGDFVSNDHESSLNIDSRLAFEEGLSRISALRLQGALARSGVLGFETPDSPDDLRLKFTRKVSLAEEAPAVESVPDVPVESDKPKERSVFNPKRAPIEELNAHKLKPVKDDSAKKPKKNPLAIVAAVIGIAGVLAVVGFVAYTKLGELSGKSAGGATAGGAGQLPAQWRMILTRADDGQTYQDYIVDIQQNGNDLSGKGRDQIGDFTLTGELTKGNAIALQKQYDSAGYIWPIMFSGHVGQNQDGSFASGSYSWRKSDAERIQGEWRSALPAPAVPTGQPGAPGQQGFPAPGGQPGMAPQQGFPPQGGMSPQPGFPPQGGQQGFPPQQGFPQQGGMPQGAPQATPGGFAAPGAR